MTLLLYLAVPTICQKNAVLLAASLFFYAYGEPVYVILLIFSALANWLLALGISAGNHRRGLLILSVAVNLGLLGVFKYSGFLIFWVNKALRTEYPVPGITLPIGISFYTFQALSYVIDVYRGECRAQRSFTRLLLYIACFPQLIAGPIVRYRDIEAALTDRRVTADGMASGIRRFLFGLSKKVLIANYCGIITDTIYAALPSEMSSSAAWLAAFAFFLQIYFDFSGYSDMAIGLGRMFGFTYLENFNYPYMAASVRDFWRRWHISLSTWLKEYLYIPLGGNRKGELRTACNKMIVFLCCGIWHGASVTFLFWGFYYGLLQLLEQFLPVFRSKPVTVFGKTFSHLYTIIAVLIGFVFFRADTLSQGMQMLGCMFRFAPPSNAEAVSLLWSVLTPRAAAALVIGTVACFPIRNIFCRKKYYEFAVSCCSLLLGAVCILDLAGGTYNPFLYFRF